MPEYPVSLNEHFQGCYTAAVIATGDFSDEEGLNLGDVNSKEMMERGTGIFRDFVLNGSSSKTFGSKRDLVKMLVLTNFVQSEHNGWEIVGDLIGKRFKYDDGNSRAGYIEFGMDYVGRLSAEGSRKVYVVKDMPEFQIK